MLLLSPLTADILPPHEIDNVNLYNLDVLVPEPGEIWSTIRATVSNSSQYNIKQIKLEITLRKEETTLHSQELLVYWDIPSGQTRDCSKNFILGYKIEDEKNFLAVIRILSMKGTLKK